MEFEGDKGKYLVPLDNIVSMTYHVERGTQVNLKRNLPLQARGNIIPEAEALLRAHLKAKFSSKTPGFPAEKHLVFACSNDVTAKLIVTQEIGYVVIGEHIVGVNIPNKPSVFLNVMEYDHLVNSIKALQKESAREEPTTHIESSRWPMPDNKGESVTSHSFQIPGRAPEGNPFAPPSGNFEFATMSPEQGIGLNPLASNDSSRGMSKPYNGVGYPGVEMSRAFGVSQPEPAVIHDPTLLAQYTEGKFHAK